MSVTTTEATQFCTLTYAVGLSIVMNSLGHVGFEEVPTVLRQPQECSAMLTRFGLC